MLTEILTSAQELVSQTKNLRQLQEIKVQFLGKNGLITQQMKKLATAEPADKKILGQQINEQKNAIQQLISKQQTHLEQIELAAKLAEEKLDMTLPARPINNGGIHPITQCMEELVQIFAKYGFVIKEGPNIEDDWHNFTALNIAANHPARQMHDTFYLNTVKPGSDPKLLRTHTSTVQIRTMEAEQPPYKFIAPGRTYRSDSDLTHTPMFHQIEGMLVDRDVHMGHLKYIITDFIHNFFEQTDIQVQFRPSFFPFTEPSAEVDIKLNDQANWLEVLGCGMVHPNVLKNVGIDPAQYRGFAFGLGVERLAMLKYGANDLRQFFEGDLRWLQHYSFAALDIPSLAGGLTR